MVRLLKERPFYGHFLLHFRREVGPGPAALGVTIRGAVPTLYVHPPAFDRFSSREQQALLEHVLKHVLHLHPARRKERHSGSWDLACDLAINPGITGLPSRALFPECLGLPPGQAAEEYYRLIARPFDTGNLEGEGYGNAARDAGSHREQDAAKSDPLPAGAAAAQTVDDHRVWAEADSTPEALAEEVVRGLVREAWRASRGEVPGEMRELVEGWLAPPQVPWRQVLRQFVATAGRVGSARHLETRAPPLWPRHSGDAQAPASQPAGRRRRLRLDRQPAAARGLCRELVRIAGGRESLLTVLYAGSRIQKIETFRSSEAVAEVYHGGGFTDLRPVFDYARTLQPRPAAVIYLTDGFGEAPEVMEFPTLWVLTREGQKPAPWGVELRLGV